MLAVWVAPHLASACSVPVFRYALERWTGSPYELTVFHRGPLDASSLLLLKRLTGDATNAIPANLAVQTVDLATNAPTALLELWQPHQTNALPAAMLRYPRGAPAQGVVWAGAFNESALRPVLDSPVRRRIVQRLLTGDCAVWLLLESGNQQEDDTAARDLQTRLDHLQKTLKLPTLDAEDVANRVISVSESELKVAFSLLRLPRHSAAEAVFVRMLLGTEEDLRDLKEPMAFPIFGRGRALFALAGKGINAETIDEACEFLIGPCSCVVKEENPGLDLLMSADWDSLVSATASVEPAPDLQGIAAFTHQPGTSAVTALGRKPAEPPKPAPIAAVPATAGNAEQNPLRTGLWIVAGLGALVLLGGALLLLRQRG